MRHLKFKSSNWIIGTAAYLAALWFSPMASAVPITTNDPATFLMLLQPGYYLESFNSVPTGLTSPRGLSNDTAYLFSGPTAPDPEFIYGTYAYLPPPATANGLFVVRNPFDTTDRAMSTSRNGYSVILNFNGPIGAAGTPASANISAFGAYVFLTYSNGCTATDGYVKAVFALSDGNSVTMNASPAGTCGGLNDYLAGFIGLTLPVNLYADGPPQPQVFINSVTLEMIRTASTSTQLFTTLNNVYVGQAVPIPEPPVWLFFALGMLWFAVPFHRKEVTTKPR
jgi:hypothetical protein